MQIIKTEGEIHTQDNKIKRKEKKKIKLKYQI